MANYTINTAGSTTCNYPSTVNANDVLTFNITNKNTTTKYQGSMLTYTFPCDCTAEILAAGARGGCGAYVATNQAGYGAIVAGTFEFKTGDQLLICVGQAGTDHPYATSMTNTDGTVGAGGGGTYVVKKVSYSNYKYTGSGTGNNWYVEPLVIGAGGNGSGDNAYGGNTRVHGLSTQGNESSFSFSSSNNGGCFSKKPSNYSDYNGYCFLDGATGASSYYNRGGTSYAGFGGGSSNWDDGAYGSPGGGFTGGYVGDEVVHAATSYVATNATNISRKSGSSSGNNGEGYVKITFKTVVPPHEFPEVQVVTTTGFNAKVKTNNSWKDGTKGYVKVNNAWKEIDKMYTKVNNQWVLTGKKSMVFVESLIDEGFVNPDTQLGEYNGTATYSAYTAGTGVQLYVASSSYPTAVGNFKTNIDALKGLKSVTFAFTRTSGNTNFNIGIFVSSTAQSGRLNSTNTNNLIKAYKTFNAASGSVTIDLEEAFGSNLNTYINSNYYIGFYLNCSAATTVVINHATLNCSRGVIKLKVRPTGASSSTWSSINNIWDNSESTYASCSISKEDYHLKSIYANFPKLSTILANEGLDPSNVMIGSVKLFMIGSGSTNLTPRYCIDSIVTPLTGQISSSASLFEAGNISSQIPDFMTKSFSVEFDAFNSSSISTTFRIYDTYLEIQVAIGYDELPGGSGGETYQDLVLLKNGTMQNIDVIGGIKSGTSATYTEGTGITLSSYNSRYYKFTFSNKIDLTNYKYATMTFKNGSTTSSLGAYFGFFKDTIASNSWTTTPFSSNGVMTDEITLDRGQQKTITLSIEDFTGSSYFGVFNRQSSGSSSSSGSIIITDIILTNTLPDESGGETQTATLRLSNMIPVSAYDSTWNNASYAYDTSSTTYAYLSLTSVMTNEQQLRFTIDTALLNAINSVTKATLKIKMSYVLNSGSSPNVGVMLKDKSGNNVYYDENFDEATSDVLTIDITNSIPNSIDNGMILYGLYTSNLYSGAKGQINLYEAYIELEYGGSGSGGGTSGDSGSSGTSLTLKGGLYDWYGDDNYGFITNEEYVSTEMMKLSDFISAYGRSPKITLTLNDRSFGYIPIQEVAVITHYYQLNSVYAGSINMSSSDPYMFLGSDDNGYSLSYSYTFDVDYYLDYYTDVPTSLLAISFAFMLTTEISVSNFTLTITPSGGSSGGGTGTSGISFRQGYIDSANGEYVPADNYESIVTDKVSVKSMSNTTKISFTVRSSTNISADAFFEVWSSDGTQGNFIGYIDLNEYAFPAYQSVTISLTKNEIANHLNASSGSNIGHVALSLYADVISVEFFTVSTNVTGATPRDDI